MKINIATTHRTKYIIDKYNLFAKKNYGQNFLVNPVIIENIENEINNYRNQLKSQNVIAVNEGHYDYTIAVSYMDTIVECEKMGDYIVNVVEAVADSKVHPVAD